MPCHRGLLCDSQASDVDAREQRAVSEGELRPTFVSRGRTRERAPHLPETFSIATVIGDIERFSSPSKLRGYTRKAA